MSGFRGGPRAGWRRAPWAAAFVIGLVPVLAAGGCSSDPPTPFFPELIYGHLAKIPLDVARIQVTTEYVPSLEPPNVEHQAPVPPYALLRRWGEQRLEAGGEGGRVAELVILDASIRETELSVTGGLKGMLRREQGARYDGRAEVRLEIRDAGGQRLAFVTARATRSATVPEGASIAERERVWFTMSEDLVAEIDRIMERQIREHFAPYLLSGRGGVTGARTPG